MHNKLNKQILLKKYLFKVENNIDLTLSGIIYYKFL